MPRWIDDGNDPQMGGGGPRGGCGRGRHGPGCCARRGGGRVRRGEVRAAILALLAERPMHGYEMISELSGRTGGAWVPSPGAVYPALQLLADEGLIDSEADGGRRRYTLTDAGRRLVEGGGQPAPPWQGRAVTADPVDDQLRRAAAHTDAALVQVLDAGSAGQKEQALEVLATARRALYRILSTED